MEKLNLTQQKHTFTNIKKCTTTQNKQNKISPVPDWRSTPLEWLSRTRDLDLDLGSVHMAYRRVLLIELYLHIKYHWDRKNFSVDRLSAGTRPSSRSRDTKTRTNSKNLARKNLDTVL